LAPGTSYFLRIRSLVVPSPENPSWAIPSGPTMGWADVLSGVITP